MQLLPTSDGDESQRGTSLVHSLMLRRASDMLVIGAGFGIVGFLYSWMLYHMGGSPKLNMYGKPFPSGVQYMPSSVSELANDPTTAWGEIFQSFVLIGCLCQLMSWYPFSFANVYLPDVSICPCLKLPVTMNGVRAIAPPIGMMLVAACHTRPQNEEDDLINTLKIAHTGGAVTAIGMYFYFEIYTLCSGRLLIKITNTEKYLRLTCVVIGIIGLASYIFCGFRTASDLGSCCDDVYLPVNLTVVESARNNGAFIVEAHDKVLMQEMMLQPDAPYPLWRGLYDTATGFGNTLKVMSFWGETTAGLVSLVSQVIIWFYHTPTPAQMCQHSE